MAQLPQKAMHSDWPDNYDARAAWWSVAMLSLFQIVSLIDRQVISVLIPEMRADLHLDDFQISLLQGLAFALFYGVMGLAIGGLVDRYSRRKIIFAGITIWSLAASWTGLARSYSGIFLGRALVGAGEGAISPAGQALLSDIFPRHRLSTPMAVFTLAGIVGISVSYALGGFLLDLFTRTTMPGPVGALAPWRQVLVATGLPGVLIAALAFTIREPRRAGAPPRSEAMASWGAFFRHIGQNRRLKIGLVLGSGLMAMTVQAAMGWTPTYARRVLHLSATETGAIMSIAVAVGGIAGGLAQGLFVDRMFSRGVRDIALRLMAGFTLIVAPLLALIFLLDSPTLLFFAVLGIMLTIGASFGPTMAAMQMISPREMKGRFAALLVLSSNLMGFAFGPMVVGLLTEYVFGDPQLVGRAIAVALATLGPLSAAVIWSARRDFLKRLDA